MKKSIFIKEYSIKNRLIIASILLVFQTMIVCGNDRYEIIQITEAIVDNEPIVKSFRYDILKSKEYMLMQCGISGKRGLNYISTSHSAKENASGGFLWNHQLRFGYALRSVFHNHPSQRLNPSKKDINVFAKVVSSVMPSVQFFVYTALEWPEYGHYREFGAYSIYKK